LDGVVISVLFVVFLVTCCFLDHCILSAVYLSFEWFYFIQKILDYYNEIKRVLLNG